MSGKDFAGRLMHWQRSHGRNNLPWQGTRDPYRIWLSEIMLQQTQVETVIPYYARFLEHFPDVAALAAAPAEAVMSLWSGLGYYARARNLHRAAQEVMAEHGGRFPRSAAGLAGLPGIGRSTAAAVAAFAYGERGAILDGNVKRVLARHAGVEGFPGEKAVEAQLWSEAEARLPATNIETYTQAMMDLGATVCTRSRPACERCPVAADCVALATGRTASLPTPRPKRTPPRRSVRVLVLRAGGAVLLELRPPAGLWGGLLTLPEIPDSQDAAGLALARFGATPASVSQLAPFDHAFTHFTLTIEPWLCEADLPPSVNEASLRWLAPADIAGAPLPAPVRRLLEGLARTATDDLFAAS